MGQTLRGRGGGSDSATLAHPEHSLHAFREILPALETWTIREDSRATPLQAYRQALSTVQRRSGDNHFVATHGGAILLAFSEIPKRDDFSTDFEVVTLHAATVDGRRLVTLGLRTAPEVKSRDQQEITYVFDAYDLFVVRSIHAEQPLTGFVLDTQFEYDHTDGRPVLRSSVTTTPTPPRTIRLDVEECRFGPIPEAEFAPEPFLTSLGPGRPKRRPTDESATAMLLDWYWLAFVGGAISLAGGSGLALRGRARDRRALKAE